MASHQTVTYGLLKGRGIKRQKCIFILKCVVHKIFRPLEKRVSSCFVCVCLLSELLPVKNFYSLHRFPKVKKKAEGGIVTWKPE